MYFIICPSCGKKHKYDKPNADDLIGKKTVCKKCKISFTISVNDLEKVPTSVVEEPVVEEPKNMKSFHFSMKSTDPPPTPISLPSISPSFWKNTKRHFAFKNMMFLSWVRAFYFISFLIAILATIGIFYQYATTPDKEPLSFAIVVAPWLALLWLRLMSEFGVIFFRIHEELVELNEKTEKLL